jgi:hypothetical protein
MKLHIYSGPPGSNKTNTCKSAITSTPGPYLVALPRIDLIREYADDLRARAGTDAAIAIVEAHSKSSGVGGVDRKIADALAKHRDHAHAVVLITHEGLMTLDRMAVRGWHVIVDEVPSSGVSSGTLNVSASIMALEQVYDLEPISGTGHAVLTANASTPGRRDVAHDDLMAKLPALHKKILGKQDVVVNFATWNDLRARQGDFTWWSVWTLLDLKEAQSVTIAAAGYETSLLHLVTEKLHPGAIRMVRTPLQNPSIHPRTIRIHFFTQGHRGSSAFWDTDPGRTCLNKICRYLQTVEIGYWSGNDVVRAYCHDWIGGEKILPRAEGTNSLRHHTSCAYIYSAKATPQDSVLATLFGISTNQIERAREIEDLVQLTFRGSLRDPQAQGIFDAYLYDRHQAEQLATYIRDNNLGIGELVPVVEAGIMDVAREAKGAGSKPRRAATAPRRRRMTVEERREADRGRKQRARAAERADCPPRGRGRPPGSSPRSRGDQPATDRQNAPTSFF